uniref:Transposase Tc1-like domain-containing protein n=1 Tax=Astyanax mexicanus TaxID=7994 RepID=A0A8B9HVS6_ASTMX
MAKKGNSSRMVAKDVGCSQSHGMVVKAKRTGRPRKTSKRQDKQLKAICLENRKSTTKQMKHKWEEAGANVCDRTVRNRLKEMGFQYRKAKRKPSLTPKHKRTRLQWAKERQSWTYSKNTLLTYLAKTFEILQNFFFNHSLYASWHVLLHWS